MRRHNCIRIEVVDEAGTEVEAVAIRPWTSGGILQRITKRLKRRWPTCTVHKVYDDQEIRLDEFRQRLERAAVALREEPAK